MQRSRCLNTSAGQLTTHALLLLMVITLFDISGVLGDESTLKSVVVVYRHGDRTPVDPYPNDPYLNKSYWPVGFGQLTNVGKEQHYEFGAWLRTRYNDFLPKDYSESDIYIRATDVDRTLMSAQANL
ncbi:prostatic acid phosphatase-like, partial [Atheta coriaria]|uniref:prostatic acid phosphatase-like n=1 Tax=Dalotia coriaria TaxID=877792 RepID=UPI0031F38F9C